jgi:hypothetical protein
MNRLLKVGITHGSGDKHSYELLTRLLAAPELLELMTPVLFGRSDAAAEVAPKAQETAPKAPQGKPAAPAQEGAPEGVKWNVINKLQDVAEGKANLLNLTEEISSAEAAQRAAEEGAVQVVLSLEALTSTEALTALRAGETSYFLTEPGDEVTASLLETARRINTALRRDFTELRPRIALILPSQSTLETTVLHDVCRTLREEGILAFGPLSEEAFLDQAMGTHYDAVVIPGDRATLNRLTADAHPDRSYGYVTERKYIEVAPIAVKHPEDLLDSLHCALYSALDIFHNRRHYAQATHAPLEKQWNPRGKDDVKLDLTKDVDAD